MAKMENDKQPVNRSIKIEGDSINTVNVSGDRNNIKIEFNPPIPESGNSRTIAILSAEIEEVSSLASEEFAAKLLQIHETYRKGKIRDALDELLAIRQGEWWKRLNAEVQAKLLRNIARYGFELSARLNEAQELVREAKALDPGSDDTLIRVMLRNAEAGSKAALVELGVPSDTTTFNLQLSMLLQSGRADEILELAQSPPEGIAPDEETARFRALALLFKGDLAEARAAMQSVLAQHSQWELVQHTAAMIEYWSSISPSVRLPRLADAPAPLGLLGVKSDPDSLRLLKQAEARFASLARETQRGDRQRRLYETWRLACLANDRARLQEAQDYCRQLLADDSAHHRVLLWAVMRGFEVDYQKSEAAIEALFEQSEENGRRFNLELTITGLALYLRLEKPEKADALLHCLKEQFADAGANDLYAYWLLRTALTRGDLTAAREAVTQTDDRGMRLHLETMILRVEAQQSNENQALIAHLEACLAETGDAEYLFELCDLRAFLRDWVYVASQAQRLIAAFNTAAAVHLASGALWHNKQYSDCLEVLEQYQSYFLEQRLPEDLWRIKVGCLLAKGRLNEAVETARALVQHASSTVNLGVLLDVYFRQGDLQSLTLTARDIVHRGDVQPEALVKAARLVRLQDQELARKLLRKAIPFVDEQPELLGAIIHTGFELNIEDETGPLLRKVTTLTPDTQTGMWVIDAKDFPAMRQRRMEGDQQAARHYGQGEIPLHLYAERFNRTLTGLLHEMPEENRRAFDPRRQFPAFIRHGSQPVKHPLIAESANWRLHLDVTALILAESLGILDDVERTFGCLFISSATQSALTLQLDQLRHQQPSRLEAYRLMIRLLDHHQMQVLPELKYEWLAFSEQERALGADLVVQMKKAIEENAYVVALLPIPSFEAERIEVPAEYAPRVINSRAVVDSLKADHVFDEAEYEAALRKLGSSGNPVEGVTTPPVGATLYLNGILAETLASAGLLETVCQRFNVFADLAYVQRARAELEANEKQEKLQEWLERLIDRVRERLEHDDYQPIQLPDNMPPDLADNDEETDENKMVRPDLHCMRDLLLFNPQPGDVIWADDRFISRHQTRDYIVPIIGISEVLQALRVRGALSETAYFEKLHRLRSGNLRYIPITKEEILFHLRRARLNDQTQVIENRELAALRQYAAACLLDKGWLQMPPMPEGSPTPLGEAVFLIELNQAIRESIDAVWADGSITIDEARARADWLLENLYTGLHGTLYLRKEPVAEPVLIEQAGTEIGALLLSAIHLDISGRTSVERPRRKAYLTWLWQRLIHERCKANPEVVSATSVVIQQIVTSALNERVKPKQVKRLSRFVLGQWYLDVSETCDDMLSLPPHLSRQLGVQTIQMAEINSLRFDADDLRRSVEKAERKGRATVRDVFSGEAFAIIRGDSDATGYAFEMRKQNDEIITKLDSFWQLVSSDKARREKILRRHRHWFDCGQEVFEKTIRQLNSANSFASRLQQAEQWRKESAEFYYRKFESAWGKRESFVLDDLLPPSGEGLLRHYRLTQFHADGLPFSEAWAQATSIVLAEEELEIALERLSCIPLKLPQSVTEALKALPVEKRHELLKTCRARWGAPMNQLHLIGLSLRCADGNSEILELVRGVVKRLFDDTFGEDQFRLFGDLLSFTSEAISRITGVKDWQTGYRLALTWAHASRLCNICYRKGLFPNFTAAEIRSSSTLFAQDMEQQNDILHSHKLQRTVFLTHGLAGLLGDIEPQLLVDSGITAQIQRKVFIEANDGVMLPNFSLFADPALETNLAGSFLGGNRAAALRHVLEEEAARLLDTSQLQEWISEALDELNGDAQTEYAWVKLWIVVGNLPLYPALGDKLATLLKRIDLPSLYRVQPSTASFALKFLAGQFPFIQDDELRSRMEEQVIQIARQAAERPAPARAVPDDKEKANVENLADLLARCAVNLTIGKKEADFSHEDRHLPLQRVFETWPQFYREIQSGVWSVIRELPVKDGWKVWPALLALRAARRAA